eukprot:SAG31_NODE_472_length_15237_cov_3.424891_4_plen_64_part_00
MASRRSDGVSGQGGEAVAAVGGAAGLPVAQQESWKCLSARPVSCPARAMRPSLKYRYLLLARC